MVSESDLYGEWVSSSSKEFARLTLHADGTFTAKGIPNLEDKYKTQLGAKSGQGTFMLYTSDSSAEKFKQRVELLFQNNGGNVPGFVLNEQRDFKLFFRSSVHTNAGVYFNQVNSIER